MMKRARKWKTRRRTIFDNRNSFGSGTMYWRETKTHWSVVFHSQPNSSSNLILLLPPVTPFHSSSQTASRVSSFLYSLLPIHPPLSFFFCCSRSRSFGSWNQSIHSSIYLSRLLLPPLLLHRLSIVYLVYSAHSPNLFFVSAYQFGTMIVGFEIALRYQSIRTTAPSSRPFYSSERWMVADFAEKTSHPLTHPWVALLLLLLLCAFIATSTISHEPLIRISSHKQQRLGLLSTCIDVLFWNCSSEASEPAIISLFLFLRCCTEWVVVFMPQ